MSQVVTLCCVCRHLAPRALELYRARFRTEKSVWTVRFRLLPTPFVTSSFLFPSRPGAPCYCVFTFSVQVPDRKHVGCFPFGKSTSAIQAPQIVTHRSITQSMKHITRSHLGPRSSPRPKSYPTFSVFVLNIFVETFPAPLEMTLSSDNPNVMIEGEEGEEDSEQAFQLFFHFSGHGDGRQLLPADHQSGHISEYEISSMIHDLLPSNATLTCVFDCCDSLWMLHSLLRYQSESGTTAS